VGYAGGKTSVGGAFWFSIDVIDGGGNGNIWMRKVVI